MQNECNLCPVAWCHCQDCGGCGNLECPYRCTCPCGPATDDVLYCPEFDERDDVPCLARLATIDDEVT